LRLTVTSERRDRTAQGYRRFRCRDGGRQFDERSGGVLNRTPRRRYRLTLQDLSEMFPARGLRLSTAKASGRRRPAARAATPWRRGRDIPTCARSASSKP